MGVDINTYRAAIGSHSDPPMKMPKISGKFCEYRLKVQVKWIKFLLLIFLAIVQLGPGEMGSLKAYQTRTQSNHIPVETKHNHIVSEYTPQQVTRRSCRYHFKNLSNKSLKRTHGNRKKNGIRICHFNKGNSFLYNRILEVENIIKQHRPHVLGISELNFFKEHNYDDVQIANYKLITAKTLENPELNVSRVGVYLHNSMVGTVRQDLISETFSSIWIEVGYPNKRKILIFSQMIQARYRQSKSSQTGGPIISCY